MSTKQYISVVFIVVFSILGSFYSGFFLKDSFIKNDNSDIPKADGNNLIPYFNDEIVLISKEEPHYTLVANASRFYNDTGSYTHRQKIFFFDGNEWSSKFSTTESNNLIIANTPTIPVWEINDDPSRVLKQKVKGKTDTGESIIEFDVPLITNELGIRSLAEYTVFRSEAVGEMIINGKKYESNVLYTRTYSYNASIGLITLSKDPIGISTNWLAFWDVDGNFYNIDETIVDSKESDPYKSHSIAVMKDNNGSVQKSFDLNLQTKKNNGYNIDINETLNRSLEIKFINEISRNPNNKLVDNKLGQVEGTIRLKDGKTLKGYGLYEYIYQ